MNQMKNLGISCVFHYVPLHSSPMGQKYSHNPEDLPVTERVSDTILRLPLYNDLCLVDIEIIVDALRAVL